MRSLRRATAIGDPVLDAAADMVGQVSEPMVTTRRWSALGPTCC